MRSYIQFITTCLILASVLLDQFKLSIQSNDNYIPLQSYVLSGYQFPFSGKVMVNSDADWHMNKERVFAYDFNVNEGEPVLASKAGTVKEIKETDDRHCGDESCSEYANYVWIDHGDGTYATYVHLLNTLETKFP